MNDSRFQFAADRASVLLLVFTCLVLGACQAGPRNFENENDRLRAANLDLQQQIETVMKQAQARERELAALRSRTGAPAIDGVEPVRFADLAIASLSGPVDTDGDGRDDLIRVYVRTLDQRERFLPVAGQALVQAAMLPDGADPVLLASRTYDPTEFDAAYVSGVTGTHYTLELPLPKQPKPTSDAIVVKVSVTQADNGLKLTAQKTMRVYWD